MRERETVWSLWYIHIHTHIYNLSSLAWSVLKWYLTYTACPSSFTFLKVCEP